MCPKCALAVVMLGCAVASSTRMGGCRVPPPGVRTAPGSTRPRRLRQERRPPWGEGGSGPARHGREL